MAEELKIRSIFEILNELFLGPDAALEKFAKVRHTQYEMDLWRYHNLPLSEVDKKAKRYFSVRFLGEGTRIDKASDEELSEAFKSLRFAVGKDKHDSSLCSGCYKRCRRLIDELNEALKRERLDPVYDPDRFLDLMTFEFEVLSDEHGVVRNEKPYNFEIRIFHDKQNRQDFRRELKNLKGDKRMMSMQDIWKLVSFRQKHSRTLKCA